MTNPESSGEDFGLDFDEWLKDTNINDTEPDPLAESDNETDTADEKVTGIPADMRAALSTVPLGIAWLFGGLIVPNLAAHSADTTRRLIGIGLMAWVISLACELSVAYSQHIPYPRLGMWEWLSHVNLARLADRGQHAVTNATGNGCLFTAISALAIPAVFALFYLFSALLAISLQLWVTTICAAVATHVAATLVRHRRKQTQ